MTPAQMRMSRAALDMTVEALAEKLAVSADDILRIEHGSGSPDVAAKLRVYYDSAGLTYQDDAGVRFAERTAAAGTVPVEQLSSANDE